MTHTLKYLTLVASLMAMQSFAQTPQEMAAAKARYKQEVIDCTVKSPVVGKENCLKEARNTLADFTHGRMNETWQASDFQKNALLRCEAHQGDDRLDCVARIRGQGRIQGSVEGGGILRELRTTKTPLVVPRESTKAPEAPLPSGLMSNCRWVQPGDWVCK